MKKLFLSLGAALIASIFVVSCNAATNASSTNNSLTDIPTNSDPELKLKTLSILNQDALSGNITVETDKTEITASDVVAQFDYGTQTKATIPVTVTNGQLNEGVENKVTISVPAKPGEYKEWNKDIIILKKPKAKPDPELELKTLSILNQDALSGNITVETDKTEITASDVVAQFDYGTQTKVTIPVTVTNGQLNEGVENTVTISVPAKPGEYKEWNKDITIFKKTKPDPELILKTLSILNQDALSGNITVETDKTEITASDVVAQFDYGTQTKVTIPVTVTNGQLNEGVENTVTISVPAKPGEYKEWNKDITIFKKPKSKISVKNIKVKFGVNEWGFYSYDNFSDLSFDAVTKKYTIKKPSGKDILAFQIAVNTTIENAETVKLKLFQGTLKDGTVNYDTEKTKNPITGTLDSQTLTFNLDETNCNELSIKDFYKVEFIINGNKDSEVFIELK